MLLPDVNVWLAAAVERHAHHRLAREWFDAEEDQRALCRVTQMGVLRLLTHQAVMGKDVLTRAQAWQVLDRFEEDDRVVWAEEPTGLEDVWRALSGHADFSTKLWTDDYLAAFAQSGKCTLITFDAGLAERHPAVRVHCLS